VSETPRPSGALTDAQWEIMNIVWDHGEVAVVELWESLSKTRGLARSTVQTQVVRLEERGWLKHRTVGKTFFYSATIDRRATVGGALERLIETAFAGSTEGLILTLLDKHALSSEAARRIREKISIAERKRKGKSQ
jgi:BlaI family penicillinase repressor